MTSRLLTSLTSWLNICTLSRRPAMMACGQISAGWEPRAALKHGYLGALAGRGDDPRSSLTSCVRGAATAWQCPQTTPPPPAGPTCRWRATPWPDRYLASASASAAFTMRTCRDRHTRTRTQAQRDRRTDGDAEVRAARQMQVRRPRLNPPQPLTHYGPVPSSSVPCLPLTARRPPGAGAGQR